MTLDCTTVKDGLPELLAPDPTAPLDPVRSAALRAHLDGCADCARERDLLVAAWVGLDRLPGLEVRPGWLAGVEAAILAADAPNVRLLRPAEGRPTAWRAGWARAAAAALLFGVALGGGWWVASPGRRAPGPEVASETRTPAPGTEQEVEAPAPDTEDDWSEPPAPPTEFFDDLDVVLALSERPREVTGPASPDDDLVRDALELLQADEALSDLDPEEVDDA
jgi:hypothetical protein